VTGKGEGGVELPGTPALVGQAAQQAYLVDVLSHDMCWELQLLAATVSILENHSTEGAHGSQELPLSGLINFYCQAGNLIAFQLKGQAQVVIIQNVCQSRHIHSLKKTIPA
jgi:hypothetical protein